MKSFRSNAGGVPPLAGEPATKLDYTVTIGSLHKEILKDILFEPNNRSSIKLVQTGDIIDIYLPERPTIINNSPSRKRKKQIEVDRTEEYVIRNLAKAKYIVRTLVDANFDKNSKFSTYTFEDTDEFDIKDPLVCKAKFKAFIKKMNKVFSNFKYLYVPEFQDKNGRGAVHFHMITNWQYFNNAKIREIWGHGFIRNNRVKHVKYIGSYVSKYMTKTGFDERLKGIRRYETSRKNLIRPQTFQASEAVKILKDKKIINLNPDNIYEYKSDFNGTVKHLRYDLRKGYNHSNE